MKNKVGIIALAVSTSIVFNANAADQVSNYAKKSGYQACLSTVSDIENFFAEDSNYGSWAFVAQDKPDDQILNATLELTYNDGSVLVDFTVSPTKDGMCSYNYTRTFYNEKSCIATTKEDFMKNATYKTEVNQFITAFEDGSSRIMLMPAGNGCVVQKKEIGYRHKKQNS